MRTLEEGLREISGHALEMLKLGETKHVGLVAFNGAVIVGMAELAKVFGAHPEALAYFLFVMAMSGISTFVSLSALIARTHRKTGNSKKKKEKSAEPLFFATIAEYSGAELVSELKKRYKLTSENAAYETDLAHQVVVTSKIAVEKYRKFNLAAQWMLAGIGSPIGLWVYRKWMEGQREE